MSTKHDPSTPWSHFFWAIISAETFSFVVLICSAVAIDACVQLGYLDWDLGARIYQAHITKLVLVSLLDWQSLK
jgi:hypothetical protein